MALFTKEKCVHCGKEEGAMYRTKLADGNYLCSDCVGKCSSFFSFKFLSKHTYPEYCRYIEHKEENKEKLRQFNLTASYFDKVFVDESKGWMLFDKEYPNCSQEELLDRNPEVFDVKDLEYFDFFYLVKDVKEGFLTSDKVRADVKLTVAFKNEWYPYAFSEKVLKNYKHKARISGIIGKRVDFTEHDDKSELEYYLLSSLLENGISYPGKLGGKFTFKIDLSPYATYFKKMFEMRKLGVYSSPEIYLMLDNIAPSPIVKSKIKKAFK